MRTCFTTRSALAPVAALLALAVFTVGCGDDDDGSATTTSTPASTTSTASSTTTAVTTTTLAPLSPTDRAFVVWPDPDGSVRYDDPVEAATAFAVELVGFADPSVGPFMQGDSRSGEVEIRANETGPVTTVLVRQYGPDDSWWVLGSGTADIEIDDPAPQSAIDDPLQVSGRARAFEGTVQVGVVADGSTELLGSGFVTGSGGTELGPFEGSIPFETPAEGWGAVIFFTTSAEDGRVWQAATVRVGFIGGD
jgi:hypothetical protein